MQIVGYKWKNSMGWKPYLIVTENDKFQFINLFDNTFAIKLGEKFCTGYFANGKRKQCPDNKKIEFGTACKECQERDEYFRCVKCTGECINEKQRESCEQAKFFIYLATFNAILKVGISQEHRFQDRLIEQGADLGAKIISVKDGMVARRTEQKIKDLLMCEDRVYGDVKHKNIFGDPNVAAMNIMKAIEKLKESGFKMIGPEIYDFRKYYKIEKLPKHPDMLEIKDNVSINGKVVAAKGSLIFFQNGEEYLSVNAHRLIGREILESNIIKEASYR